VWCTNSLQATLSHYFYPHRMVDEGDAGAAAQVKAHAEAKAGALLDQVEAALGAHGGDWLLGPTYTAVDPLLFVLCRWTRNFMRPARSLPARRRLSAADARAARRWQRAFATEKLLPPLV